jgi:hypothetical protein
MHAHGAEIEPEALFHGRPRARVERLACGAQGFVHDG